LKKNNTKNWLDAWHLNPNANLDYGFIDGLRGIAILMVVAAHHIYINPKAGPRMHFIDNFLGGSATDGVMLFFAISGFLISWPFWKRKFSGSDLVVPPGYGWRRFWKIYPPLALSILILTPVYIFLSHDGSYLPIAAKWLAGIPFLLPVSGKLNPVMWTLVVEVQFYILLPLIFISLKSLSGKACLFIVSIIFLFIPLVFRMITGLSPMNYPEINPHFPSALDSFGLGVLIAGLENMGVMKKSYARLGVVGAVLLPLALLLHAWIQTLPETKILAFAEGEGWMIKIAAGCLLCFVADTEHPIAKLLCVPWLRWCGIISYEWYLFHRPIALWVREIFGPAVGSVGKYAVIVGGSFFLSLTIAALIYRYFSLPLLKYGRSIASRK
jgi:peptidoglycan/LPS O-acetylase OafA/YrhL